MIPPVLCLSVHASYACRHAGACCTAGWPIPVETALYPRLTTAIADGRLALPGSVAPPFETTGGALPGAAAVLRSSPSGACACYEADRRRCAIHRQLGHDALPSSCQHFPRACLLDEDATLVTLSHFCPTACGLLFEDGPPLECVTAPPGLAPMRLEGLDARGALPPLLHPGMLADRPAYRAWERHVVALLEAAATPEEGLARTIALTEEARRWHPRDGTLLDALETAARRAQVATVSAPTAGLRPAALALDDLARKAVPVELGRPTRPPGAASACQAWVVPTWNHFSKPVRRFLAAHAFANWCAYQGRGLRTVAWSLVAALSVLRVEAARQCETAGRRLDAALLAEAFRSADLLLVHLASREELAARLSQVESLTASEMVAPL